MNKKNISLLITCHQPYIRHINGEENKYSEEVSYLFEMISNTYLPLLDMFSSLENDKVPFHVSMVFSASLCEMLNDSVIQQQYLQWLDRQIVLGQKELERLKDKSELYTEAKRCLDRALKDKYRFTVVYNQKLLCAFASFVKKGYVEILATAGTYAFLPLYSELPEIINAQIEIGLYACRTYFDVTPEGFYLPYMGYFPGVENQLRAYGFQYTILETHGILYSDISPENGIFYPVRSDNSLMFFARDPDTQSELCGEKGFIKRKEYLDVSHDIAYELPYENLSSFLSAGSARISSYYHYWNNEGRRNPEKILYNQNVAFSCARTDADAFLKAKILKLEKALTLVNTERVMLSCVFEDNMLGQNWAEGVQFFENIFREGVKFDINFVLFNEMLSDQFLLQKIHPMPSASFCDGYGMEFLNNSNNWMMPYLFKASERMIDLSDRFPDDTGLKARLLNLGAKELLLAQAGELPIMINNGQFSDYFSELFKKNILSFTAVFDSLGSNTVSTEWLTRLEKEHPLFPWINYHIFCKKK